MAVYTKSDRLAYMSTVYFALLVEVSQSLILTRTHVPVSEFLLDIGSRREVAWKKVKSVGWEVLGQILDNLLSIFSLE